jgi:hypothetical protein
MEHGKAAAQVVAEASVAIERSKKARGGFQERAQPAPRRCGNCGGTGHNARTCLKDAAKSSDSKCTLAHLFLDSSSGDDDNPA